MQKKYAIGVDVGGSHITCVALDLTKLSLCKETLKREHLSHTDTAENLFKIWAKAITECGKEVGFENVSGIGFAIPGPFDYANGISLMEHKYPNLKDIHIPTELSKLLPFSCKMNFMNDASAFGVGVCWLDAGKNHQKVIALTLGTGFGSVYLENGKVLEEGENLPKEACFWHLPFKEGIADDYFSTRWFVNSYKKITGEEISGVKDILNQPESNSIFTEFGENLAEFLSPWLKKFPAEMIVLGGNIALSFNRFEQSLQNKLKNEGILTKFAVSSLMEDAALVGAVKDLH